MAQQQDPFEEGPPGTNNSGSGGGNGGGGAPAYPGSSAPFDPFAANNADGTRGQGPNTPHGKYGIKTPGVWGDGYSDPSMWADGFGGAGEDYRKARDLQSTLAGQYQDMIAGNGPSVAEAQMQAGLQNSIAAQRQLAASGRGGNMAAASRGASQAGAGMAINNNANAAMLRAQEQASAMEGLASLTGTMTGQNVQQQGQFGGQLVDINNNIYNTDRNYAAQMRQMAEAERAGKFSRVMQGISTVADTVSSAAAMSDERQKQGVAFGGDMVSSSLFDLSVAQNNALNTNRAMLEGLKGGGGGVTAAQGAQQVGQQGGEPIRVGGLPMPAQAAEPEGESGVTTMQMPSQGATLTNMSAISDERKKKIGYGAMSDENNKGSMGGGGAQLSDALSEVPAVSFEYKPSSGMPPGQRLGTTAQALEQVPGLQSMVVDTPQGKVVDGGQAAMAALAGSAEQERRLRVIEQMMGMKGGQ